MILTQSSPLRRCQRWPPPSLSPFWRCWWWFCWSSPLHARRGTARARGRCWKGHRATLQTGQGTTPSMATASGSSRVLLVDVNNNHNNKNCSLSVFLVILQLPVTVTVSSWTSPSWTQSAHMITCLCMTETPTRARSSPAWAAKPSLNQLRPSQAR